MLFNIDIFEICMINAPGNKRIITSNILIHKFLSEYFDAKYLESPRFETEKVLLNMFGNYCFQEIRNKMICISMILAHLDI